MKQILTSLLMAIAMIFMGTTTAKADVSNEETGQYVLKCGNVSMTIDAAKGGKILSYKYGDQEVISQLKWPEAFGSTFWTSPQKEWYWPPVPEYDKKPYQVEEKDGVLTMTSEVNEKLKFRIRKAFAVDEPNQTIAITYSIINASDEVRKVAPWEITRVQNEGGLIFFEAPVDSIWPAGLMNFKADGSISCYEPDEANENRKVNADGKGWLAYLNQEKGLLLVKQFEDLDKSQPAPDEAEIQVYVNRGKTYIELESQGAYTTLQPGRSIELDRPLVFAALQEYYNCCFVAASEESDKDRQVMAKKEGKELTPMMKQFFDLKAKHPDAVMLFRCGDFYETYCEDAITASKILGITLTHRNNGAGVKGDEMAGFPHHALDTYLPKLIRAGKRVAICDQLEDPKLTKKLVKRGITELVTPGVALSDNVLNYKENNFLAAVHFGKGSFGVAFLDISTGEFLTGEGTQDYVEKLLGNFSPKEILHDRTKKQEFERNFGTKYFTFQLDDWVFTEQTSKQKLLRHFNVKNLKGFGVDHLQNGVIAAGAILQYLEQTQHTQIGHITSISRIEEDKYVRLDKFTIRSLELVHPMQDDGKSLLDVIDKTVSPMGGRLLRRWLVFPLKDEKPINSRLDIVEYYYREPEFRECIDDQLHRIGDLERIISKAAVGRVSPREVVQLKVALQAIQPIKTACLYAKNEALNRVGEQLNLCESLRDRIEKEIQNDPPQLVAKGGVIRDGVNAELDELRSIAYSGKDYLLKIQEREVAETGISSLKIGYNNVFGYYLEVRNTYKDLVPPEWVRKQTLAQAERYITQELKEYEEKILGAEDKILSLEAKLFNDLVLSMQEFIPQIQINANIIARLDCLLSFAKTAEENKYIRPVIDGSEVIDIKQGRHPVIEQELPLGERYVPNDILLDNERQQIIIITGPNMAGKSALLRQTALIVLMAQIGCFVPAEAARIGLVDKIFTRVGASDNISLGESTFMVEMTEASNILNNVSSRSLVLFDELGRGTSTYDGISIAWAIVEYLHENAKGHPRTLFATHYHELNEMEKNFSRIKNYNVSVKEVDGKVIFLRKLEKGGSEHSFGIHVAEIAGMPRSIVKRANVILKELEADNASVGTVGKPTAEIAASREGMQLSFFQLDDPVLCQVRDEILGIDVNNLTPLEALNKLNDIKKIVSGK